MKHHNSSIVHNHYRLKGPSAPFPPPQARRKPAETLCLLPSIQLSPPCNAHPYLHMAIIIITSGSETRTLKTHYTNFEIFETRLFVGESLVQKHTILDCRTKFLIGKGPGGLPMSTGKQLDHVPEKLMSTTAGDCSVVRKKGGCMWVLDKRPTVWCLQELKQKAEEETTG